MKIEKIPLFHNLVRFIETNSSKKIIGFSRSLLATGLLLKLLFFNFTAAFPSHQLQTLNLNLFKYRFNFFLLINSSHLFEMQLLAIIILMVIISGYLIKITSLFHFWILESFFMLRQISGGMDDSIHVNNIYILLTLLLIPVCLFDERKNHWHYPITTFKFNSLIQNAFLFFIKLQVAFIYLDSVYNKLYIKEWVNGTVIYYWFTHNFFGLHPVLVNLLQSLLTNIIVLRLLAWGILAFEALLAAALFFPFRFKLLLLKCGIIFHFSILLIHGFTFLFFGMSAALFLYLYPPGKSFSLYVS